MNSLARYFGVSYGRPSRPAWRRFLVLLIASGASCAFEKADLPSAMFSAVESYETPALEILVDKYRKILNDDVRVRLPMQWAETEANLGSALEALGERETGTERYVEAISAFNEALKIYTHDRAPRQRAVVLTNSGVALTRLGDRAGFLSSFEEAIKAYREALSEFTRDEIPLEWGVVKTNIWNSVLTTGRAERRYC